MRERPFSNLYIFGSGVNVENVNLGQCRYSVQIFFRPKAYPTCVSSKFCKFIEFIDPQTIDFKPFSTRRHPTIPQLPIISCTFFVNPPSTSTYLASTNPDMWLSQPCSTTSILDPGNKYSHLETFSWEEQIALNQGGRGSSLLPQEQLISSYPENVNLNRTNFHPESF